MKNYRNFEEECEQALHNGEISKQDEILLTKIAKAIANEDENITMTLKVFDSLNSHTIKCDCLFVDNWQDKIKKALQESYFYYRNVWQGWSDCSITVKSNEISKGVRKIISEHRDNAMYKALGQKRKQSCQFGDFVDAIVQLAQKGQYEKCDGIIEDLIRNYNTSVLISEEEMLNDLEIVINGTSEEIEQITDKYNSDITNIKNTLMIKIRSFDRDYMYRTGFFDLNPSDHEIIERKLKGKPFSDVKPFKMLSEVKL